MKIKIANPIRLRMMLVGVLFSIGLVSIAAKAVQLQVLQGSWLSQKAARQYEKSQAYIGKRGTIYDAGHTEMAVSIDVTSIGAYPHRVVDKSESARQLGRILGIKRKVLKQRLSSRRSFVWIKRQVTPKERRAVAALKLAGVDFIPVHSRVYPNKTLAAQALGFSGIDGHGLEGIEFYYDSFLNGKSFKRKVVKDALGRGFEPGDLLPDSSGHNLILTIDKNIQYITESALARAVTEFGAKAGVAIVMSPKTGAILAMAHYPFFNPNTFGTFSRETWRNRAITDPFEPGSTMKVFTAAAALESKIATVGTKLNCENGKYRIGKDVVHDTKPHKWLTLLEIVKYSSNIGAVKLGEAIGPQILHKTLVNFGFGAKTRIDCPGESAGSLSHYKEWSKIDAAAIAFGQGISATPMQLVTALSAIANDGVLMKPHIVQVITDHNGRPVKNFNPQTGRRVVSIKTARTIKRLMHSVTRPKGTGVSAAVEGYTVAGKTGTAQKASEAGSYEEDKYVSSFFGFVPVQNPELSILVVVDEPQTEYYGSKVAAPTFRAIAHDTLTYLSIPPENGGGRLTARLKGRDNV